MPITWDERPPIATETIYVGEDGPWNFDFSKRAIIVAGATIASAVVTATEGDGTLTIGSCTINSGAVTIDGRTIAVGQLVQVNLSTPTAGVIYLLRCVATLAVTSKKIIGFLRLQCPR